MTDDRGPAVEAAQRALSNAPMLAKSADEQPILKALVLDAGTSAACEALAPIRELHRPFVRNYPGGDGRTVCNHCLGPRDWPCTTALYAYTSEELAQ